MDHICRICRDDSETVILVNIFEEPELAATEPTLAEIINECNRADCQILPNDALPQKICQACVLAAQSAFRFKRLCEESYHHFCQQLAPKEVATVIKMEPDLDIAYEENKCDVKDSTQHQQWETAIESNVDSNQLTSLNQIINPHRGPYQCSSCSHSYKHFREFQRHLATHTWRHMCEICNQGFGYKIDLNQHKARVHNVYMTHTCSDCRQRFATRSDLNKHKNAPPKIQRGYKCPICARVFIKLMDAKKHLTWHSGGFPNSQKLILVQAYREPCK